MTAEQRAEQRVAELQIGQGGVLPASRPVSGKRGVAGPVSGARKRAQPLPVNSKALCEIVVKKLFGNRRWAAEWALALCAADPQFLPHLADQSRGYVHYLCVLRLALLDAGDLQDADDRVMRGCAHMIRTTSKKALLKTWFPSCPPGLLNVLPKLQEKPLSLQTEYRQLIRALADKEHRKFLSHLDPVRAFHIQLLDMMNTLPAQFRFGAAHCDDVADYEELCMLIECTKRLNLEVTEREFSALAGQVKDMEGLWRWFARRVLNMPFPPPPWNGDDKIRPLCSCRELEEAGRRFRNCAAEYAFRVVAGYSYLYVCEQPQAMVEIVSDVFFGWMVNEIEGAERKSLSKIEVFEIKRAFHNAGICRKVMEADDFHHVDHELRDVLRDTGGRREHHRRFFSRR